MSSCVCVLCAEGLGKVCAYVRVADSKFELSAHAQKRPFRNRYQQSRSIDIIARYHYAAVTTGCLEAIAEFQDIIDH
jgi:hypothetical protein